MASINADIEAKIIMRIPAPTTEAADGFLSFFGGIFGCLSMM